MKEISQFQYDVVRDEKITFHVTPYGIPLMVTALLNGVPLSLQKQNTFSFKITEPIGSILVLALSFDFPVNSSPNDLYRVGLTSSKSGNASFLVVNISQLHDPVLVFRVKKGDTGPK